MTDELGNSKGNRQRSIRKGYVEISDEVRAELVMHADRTGIGAVRLLKDSIDCPEGLTYLNVQAWISGDIGSAQKSYLDYVLSRWKSLPDSDVVEITPEIISLLRSEAERTGTGVSALFRGVRPSEVGGMNASIVKNWLAGGTKMAKREHLEFVLERWKALPDKQVS